jgi:hypothetical protein
MPQITDCKRMDVRRRQQNPEQDVLRGSANMTWRLNMQRVFGDLNWWPPKNGHIE